MLRYKNAKPALGKYLRTYLKTETKKRLLISQISVKEKSYTLFINKSQWNFARSGSMFIFFPAIWGSNVYILFLKAIYF